MQPRKWAFLKRLIVIDAGDEQGLIKMINPEIIASEGEQFGPEGCLSIPGINGDVRRFETVTVKGLDREGNELIITGKRSVIPGIPARD